MSVIFVNPTDQSRRSIYIYGSLDRQDEEKSEIERPEIFLFWSSRIL